MPCVLTLAESLDGVERNVGSIEGLHSSKTVDSASIVEEAKAAVELRLFHLGKSLPNFLLNDISLAMLSGLAILSKTSGDENLLEIWIDSYCEVRSD